MSRITVIGGIRANITVRTTEQLMMAAVNPGTISAAYSGTGRNIAENLGRMGADAAMVAVAGNDLIGRGARAELEQAGVNAQAVALVEGRSTPMRIKVLNIIGDMDFGMSDSTIYDLLTPKQIEAARPLLEKAEVICVDGTLPEETLRFLADEVHKPLFLDPHSEEGAEKAKPFIRAFDTIKPNRAEASIISGMEILSEEQLMAAGQWFAEQGVRRIFITLSGGGVYYKEGMKEGILRPEQLLSADYEEGAGDAFSAALLDGTIKGMAIEALAAYGMRAAAVAMETEQAVNPAMCADRLAK